MNVYKNVLVNMLSKQIQIHVTINVNTIKLNNRNIVQINVMDNINMLLMEIDNNVLMIVVNMDIYMFKKIIVLINVLNNMENLYKVMFVMILVCIIFRIILNTV